MDREPNPANRAVVTITESEDGLDLSVEFFPDVKPGGENPLTHFAAIKAMEGVTAWVAHYEATGDPDGGPDA